MFNISKWVPGSYPIPFFQTWKCKNSAVTTESDHFDQLTHAGLSSVLFDCVHHNLRVNRVGIDCIHYLFNDDSCRDFLAITFPPDVVYAYDELIPSAFRADLWRYCILYMFGGVYMDIKYKWCGGGGGGGDVITIRNVVDRWLNGGSGGGSGGGSAPLRRWGFRPPATDSDGGGGVDGGDSADGGADGCVSVDHNNSMLVLERDSPGLWPEGHFGIHNAFIISKPKNRLFFECIRQIVSYSKSKIVYPLGVLGRCCPTLPLFITGPGLLGDVWRKMHSRNGGDIASASASASACLGNYALMAQYFRLFYQGNGVIGYFYDNDVYCILLRVCDNIGYNPPDHYTILWASGIVWR